VMLKLDSAFLLSILIDELLSFYDELAAELEEGIEAIEERALTDESDAFLDDLLAMKRRVFAVFRLAGKHRSIMEGFLRPDFPLAGGATTQPYFRDLYDRLEHLMERLEAAKESINGAFDLYVSQVSRRTNDIMKVLAIVSTIVLPSSVILAFFGTSFNSLPIDTGSGFVVMMVSIVLITMIVLYLFFHWGWIGHKSPRSTR
jgi:magnesium transporter